MKKSIGNNSQPVNYDSYWRSIKDKLFLISIIFFLILSMIFITSGDIQAETRTVTDISGREITIPDSPERIVALGAGMMRKIAYFQKVDKIVGVEDIENDPDDFSRPYQLANPELLNKTTVGPMHGGDAELIAGVEPDLILFSGDVGEARDLSSKLEIPVVKFDFGDIYNQRELLYDSIELIGEILEESERAEELIDFIEESIVDLNDRTKDIPEEDSPEVYAGGMSFRGHHGFNSIRYPFPPFEFINASDVTDDYLDYQYMTHVELSRELLLEWDPEIVFIDLGNLHLVQDDFDAHQEYSFLQAYQNNNMYGLLPYANYHVNFSSVLANSYYTGYIIYPEAFSDIDPVEKADEIYEKMLGETVYQEMAEEYGGFGSLDLE